jgi:hypothetical protein
MTLASALTTTIFAIGLCCSPSSRDPGFHRIQSTPLFYARSTKSSTNAVNGTTTTLVPAPLTNAGNMNNTLLPPPVGNITINDSRPLILMIFSIASPCSFVFHAAFEPINFCNPFWISSAVAPSIISLPCPSFHAFFS